MSAADNNSALCAVAEIAVLLARTEVFCPATLISEDVVALIGHTQAPRGRRAQCASLLAKYGGTVRSDQRAASMEMDFGAGRRVMLDKAAIGVLAPAEVGVVATIAAMLCRGERWAPSGEVAADATAIVQHLSAPRGARARLAALLAKYGAKIHHARDNQGGATVELHCGPGRLRATIGAAALAA